MNKSVPHEVHAAELQTGAQHLGDGSHDPLIGIGDDKLYAPEPALRQLAQEGRPDGFNLRRDDLEPQNLASAVTVGAGCDDDGDGDHAATAAGLQIGASIQREGQSPLMGRSRKAFTSSLGTAVEN